MSSRLTFNTADFRAELRKLTPEMIVQAQRIVESNANAAAFDIRSGYGAHRHSGKLQSSVRVEHKTSGGVVRSVVRATAPHAHLFERGTEAVRYTKTGASRGRMPPGNIFIPRIIKWRRRMFEELRALLVRSGLLATGDVNARAA